MTRWPTCSVTASRTRSGSHSPSSFSGTIGAGDDSRVAFGRRLRAFREARGISQEELADEADLDRTYVSSTERGRRNVSLLSIYRLAQALRCEPSELFRS